MNFKILHWVSLLWLLTLGPNCQALDETHFHAGVAAYEAGQFESAANAFSNSLVERTASGTLLNLGLAEWRQGRTGDAILVWEQASWLNPFNRSAQENLLYAREAIQVIPPELSWYEQFSTWLPASYWMWIMSISLWLAVALMTLPDFFRVPRAGWHQTVAALALGVFLFSLAPLAGIFARSKIGIVTDKSTSLRLTPTQTAEAVAVLSPGEPVRELRQRGNYLFVRTQNGDGWVEHRQIQFIVPQHK